MLRVKLLEVGAKAPTVVHPGEDIGYDLYALETVSLWGNRVVKVRTGVAVEATDQYGKPVGLIVKDRSSMAAKGIFTHGGVIDAGYRGEITVLMNAPAHVIHKGDKIAQLVPVPVLTGPVDVVDELKDSSRGEKGFGSSGS